jgi:hypothetical protein
MTPAILSIVAGISSVVSLLALISFLFYSYRVREIERSERSVKEIVEGEGPFDADAVVQILRAFRDDNARLKAIKTIANFGDRSAERIYEKVKGKVDLTRLENDRAAQIRKTSVGAAIFFGLVAAIAIAYPFISEELIPATSAQNCSKWSGYPKGRWALRGVSVINGRQDTSFTQGLYFDSDTEGWFRAGLGTQLPDGTYPMESQAPLTTSQRLTPGATFKLTFGHKEAFTPEEEKVATPADRSYKATNVMTVSPDGCSMRGRSDPLAPAGGPTVEADYCWDAAQSLCPPLPNGWRPPVLPPRGPVGQVDQ